MTHTNFRNCIYFVKYQFFKDLITTVKAVLKREEKKSPIDDAKHCDTFTESI